MTDLSQFLLTPLEDRETYIADSPSTNIPEPDYKAFSEWGEENATGNEEEDYKNYSSFVRDHHLTNDTWNPAVELDLRNNYESALESKGLLDRTNEDAINALYAPKEISFDARFQATLSTQRSESPAWQAVNEYVANEKALSKADSYAPETRDNPIVMERQAQLREAAEAAVSGEEWNQSLLDGVNQNNVVAARVETAAGPKIRLSKQAKGMSTKEIIQATQHLGITSEDALEIEFQNTAVNEKGTTQAEIARYADLGEKINVMFRDEKLAGSVYGEVGEDREGRMLGGLFHTNVDGQGYLMGPDQNRVMATPHFRAKKGFEKAVKALATFDNSKAEGDSKEIARAEKVYNSAMQDLGNILSQSGLLSQQEESVDQDDLKMVVDQMASGVANERNLWKFQDDPDKLKYNLKDYGYAEPMMHTSAVPRKQMFEAVIKANPDLSDQQITNLRAQRRDTMIKNFDHYSQILESGNVSDEWIQALQVGRAEGIEDIDILEKFVDNDENYSEIAARVGGVGWSIPNALGSALAAIPAMAGSEYAQDYLQGMYKSTEARRETARLFGVEMGMGQELMETVVPVLTDVAITGVLAAGTAGIGGAAYLTAKTGAKITAKGLAKGIVTNAFKVTGRETAEKTLDRLVTKGFVTSPTKAGKQGAMDVIDQFSKIQSSKLVTIPAMAVPAFNRSAGMTYASAYKTLTDTQPEMSHQDKHDRALGAGLLSGAFTAFITGSFGALGAGGAEKMFLQGASKKHTLNVINRLSSTGKMVSQAGKDPDEILAGVLKAVSKKATTGSSKYGTKSTFIGEILKDAGAEGTEEFIDEFVNGVVTDVYTDQDTPLLDRLTNAGWAAVAGGIFGAGMPLAGRALQSRGYAEAVTRNEERAVQTRFIKDVTAGLRESGSPMTEQIVGTILTAKAGDVDSARAAYDAYKERVAPRTDTGEGGAAPEAGGPTPTPAPEGGAPAVEEEAPVTEEAAPATEEAAPEPVEIPQGEEEFDFDIEPTPTPSAELVEGDFVQVQSGNLARVVTIKRDVQVGDQTYATVVGLSNGAVIPSETGSDTVSRVVRPTTPEPETIEADQAIDVEAEVQPVVVEPSIEKSEPYIRQKVVDAIRQNGVVDTAFISREIEAVTGETSPEAEAQITSSENYVVDADNNIVGAIDPVTSEVVGVDQDTQDIETIVSELEGRTEQEWDEATRQYVEEEEFNTNAESAPVRLGLQITETEAASLEVDYDSASGSMSPAAFNLLSPPPTEIEIENLQAAGIDPEELATARSRESYEAQLEIESEEPETNFTEAEATSTFSAELEELVGGGDPNGNSPRIEQVIASGYPVRIARAQNFGIVSQGQGRKFYSKASDYVATQIYDRFPWIDVEPPVAGREVKTQGDKANTWFNPVTQQSTRSKQRAYVDANGNGIFDNNPLTMELLIAEGVPVVVPADIDPETINPALRDFDPIEGRLLKSVKIPSVLEGMQINKTKTKAESRDTIEDTTSLVKYSTASYMFDEAVLGNLSIPVAKIPTGSTTIRNLEAGETVTVSELIEATDSYVTASLSGGEGGFRSLMSPRGKPLGDNYLTTGSLSVTAETKYNAFTYAVRQEILQEGGANSILRFVQQNAEGKYELKRPDSLTDRTGLMNTLMKFTSVPKTNQGAKTLSRELAKMMKVNRSSPNNIQTLSNFVLDEVLNSSTFKDGKMPDIAQMANTVATRMAGQQRTAETNGRIDAGQVVEIDASREDNPAAINLDKEVAAEYERSNVNDMAPARDDAYISKDEAATILSGIDSNKEVRAQLENVVLNSVMNYTPANRKKIKKLPAVELMRRVQAWVSEGRQNNKVNEFLTKLEEGNDPEIVALRNALKTLNVTTATAHGNLSQDSGYTQGVQQRFASGADARAFTKAETRARRSRMAKSRVNQAGQAMANQLNTAEASRLGLVSGDPESVINALKMIAANRMNKQHALVAELLLENETLIRSVDFTMEELNLGKYAGLYTKNIDGTHSVTLNLNGHNGKGLTNVLLEEYLHATLSDAVNKPVETMAPAQRQAVERLNGLMAAIRQSAVDAGYTQHSPIMDSLGNMDEFIAGVLLSEELQQEITSLGAQANSKKGFWKQLLDTVLRFFKTGVTSAEAEAYANAISDVILVRGGAGVEATARTAAKRIAKVAMSRMDRNTMALRAIGIENLVGYADRTAAETAEQPVSDRAQRTLNSSLETEKAKRTAEVDRVVDTMDELDTPDNMLDLDEAQLKMRAILQHIRELVPPEVALAFDREGSGPAKMQGGKIFLNPENIFKLTQDLDIVSSRLLMSAVIEEELAHVASYNVLPQAEIDELAASMSTREFDRIANNYFTTNKDKQNEIKALIATEITEDMDPDERAALESDILAAKRMLVEEHLRSMTQRVTRGYTTEEDYAFYKTNPSMLKILWRYMSAVFKRLAAARELGVTGNKYKDTALNRMIDELRAIKNGYRLAPTHLNFDANNPTEAFAALSAIINEPIVQDPAIFLEELKSLDALNALSDFLPVETLDFVAQLSTGQADYPEIEDAVEGDDVLDRKDAMSVFRKTIKDRHAQVVANRTEILNEAKQLNQDRLPAGSAAVDAGFYEVAMDIIDDVARPFVLEYVANPVVAAENILNIPSQEGQQDALEKHFALFSEEVRLTTDQKKEMNFEIQGGMALDFEMNSAEMAALDSLINNYLININRAQLNMVPAAQERDTGIMADLHSNLQSMESLPQMVGTTDLRKLKEALTTLADNGFMEVLSDDLNSSVSPAMIVAVGKLGSRHDVSFDIEPDGSIHVGGMFPRTMEDEIFHIETQRSKGLITEVEADESIAAIETIRDQGGVQASSPDTLPLIVQVLAKNNEINAPAITTQGAGSSIVMNASINRRNVIKNAIENAEGLDPAAKQTLLSKTYNPSSAMTNGYSAWAKWGFENLDGNLQEFTDTLNRHLPLHVHTEFTEWLATLAPESYANSMVNVDMDTLRYASGDVNIRFTDGELSFSMLGDVGAAHARATAAEVQHVEDNFRRIVAKHSENIQSLINIATTADGTWSIQKVIAERGGASMWMRYGWDQDYRFDLEIDSPSVERFGNTYGPIYNRAKSRTLNSSLEGGFDESSIDLSGFIKGLEMPVYKTGDYNAPRRWYNKWFQGELDPRITDLHKNRLAYLRGADLVVKKYKSKMDKLTKKAFNGEPTDEQKKVLEQAMGDARGVVVSADVLDAIDKTYTAELNAIRANTQLTNEQADAADAAAKARKEEAVKAEEVAARDEILRTKATAMAEIESLSPELAQHIRDIRSELITPLSTYIKDNFGLSEELQARMDSNMDIYITRSYRMFTDAGYLEKVQTDPAFHEVREAAMKYFEKVHVQTESKRLQDELGMSSTEAEARARAGLKEASESGHPIGQKQMDLFLENYNPNMMSALAQNHSETHKVLLDNLKEKKDLDISLRNLLGEYGQDGTVDNLLRTFSVVAKMSANQAFLNQLKTMGVQEGFLLTHAELEEARDRDHDQYKTWVAVRPSGTIAASDPLSGMYGPPELVDGLLKTFDRTEVSGLPTGAELAIGTFGKLVRKASGLAMASKTLLSTGFFVRNAVSNMLFFGPAQGYNKAIIDVPLIMKRRAIARGKGALTGGMIEEEIIEYTRLGIIGDEVRSTVMLDLLRGKTSPDILMEQQENLLAKVKKKGRPLEVAYEKAAELAAAIDAVYKIGYFEHELKILRKASKVVGSEITDDETKLRQMAAKKVKMTAQSHSEAPPIIGGFGKSSASVLIAPFVRFKAEVPRIVINTYKLGMEEIRSGNPVLQRRGGMRMFGMTTMLGVWSSALPMVLQAMAGIGQDEDEAMRAGIPEYLRGHTFFYKRDEETGELRSLDLTFANPFSLMADPTLRAIEDIRRGKFASATGKFLNGLVFDQYLDEQILASAVLDVAANRSSQDDNPIYEERTDDGITKMTKTLTYLLKEAYGPDIGKRFKRAWETRDMDPTMLRREDMPVQVFIDGFKPFKTHTVDLSKQYRRFLYELKDESSRIGREKYVAFSRKPLSDDKLGQIYHTEVAKRIRIQNELIKVSRGYVGLGMSRAEVYRDMTAKNVVSKARAKNAFMGVIDRPMYPPSFYKDLIAKSEGENPTMSYDEAVRRAQNLWKAQATYGARFIEVEEKF